MRCRYAGNDCAPIRSRAPRGRGRSPRARHDSLDGPHYAIRGEPEILEDVGGGRRHPKRIDAERGTVDPYLAGPAGRDARLDGNPRRDPVRQHRLAVGARLRCKGFAAGHGDDAHAVPAVAEHSGRLDGYRDLRAGGDDNGFGHTVTVPNDVAAPPNCRELLVVAVLMGQALARQQQRCRPVAALERGAPGDRRLDGVTRTPHGEPRNQA